MAISEQPSAANGGEGGAPEDSGLNDADFESNWDETTETFDAMDLPEELLRGIFSYGFEKPSAIQQRAIKPVMLGRDLIAQAQSGTVSWSSVFRFDACSIQLESILELALWLKEG